MGESQTLAGGAQGRITEVAGRLELGLPLRQAAKEVKSVDCTCNRLFLSVFDASANT